MIIYGINYTDSRSAGGEANPGLCSSCCGDRQRWPGFSSASTPASFLALAGAYASVNRLRHQREYLALVGSTFVLFGVLTTGAAALYPVMLFSTTDANLRLTAADCAAPAFSLGIAAVWWFPALILAVCYLLIIQRHYSGKVNVSKDSQQLY